MGVGRKKGKEKKAKASGRSCWVQSLTFRTPFSVPGSRNFSKRHTDHVRCLVCIGYHSNIKLLPKVVHRLWAVQTLGGNATSMLVLAAAIQTRIP